MTAEGMQIVQALAQALDRCDWDAAAASMAPDCRYVVDEDEVHTGPDAIIASYRAAHEKAVATLDNVSYGSEVSCRDGVWVIRYTDMLRHGERAHTHVCEQTVRVSPQGRIDRIEHCALPGERAALDDWFDACGIVWDA